MIEAVNSVIANASVLRAGAEQLSSLRSDESSRPPPEAPYVSPYIEVDGNSNRAVLQIRNPSTGDVVRQFPSESRLRQLAAEQAALDRAQSGESSSRSAQSDVETSSNTLSTPDVSGSAPSADVNAAAEARAAAAALANGSEVGGSSNTLSAGVSVIA